MAGSLPDVGVTAIIAGIAPFDRDSAFVLSRFRQLEQATLSLSRTSAAAGNIAAPVAALGAAAVIAGAAIAGAFVASVKSAADLQQTLTFVRTTTAGTGDQMNQLGTQILEMSRKSTQGIGALAEGAADLARAGLTIPQIMGGALKAVNDLTIASAGELGLSDAAKLVANGINAFGLSLGEASRVADAAALVAQRSTLTFTDFGLALQYAGPIARSLGFSIEDLSILIAELGKNAITGSVAGTSLRQMFLDLATPSAAALALMKKYNISLFDTAGAARPARDVLIDLNKEFGDQAVAAGKLTDAQRLNALGILFNNRAAASAIILAREGVGAFDDLAAAQGKVTASGLAANLLLPLDAQVRQLWNSVEALAIAFGQELLPLIQPLVQGMLNWAQSIPLQAAADLGHEITFLAYASAIAIEQITALAQKFNNEFRAAVIGVGAALLIAFGPALVSAIGAATAAMWGFVVATTTALGELLLAVAPFVALAALVGVAAYLIITHGDEIKQSLSDLGQIAQILASRGFAALGAAASALGSTLSAFGAQAAQSLSDLGSIVGILAGRMGSFFNELGTAVSQSLAKIGGVIGGWAADIGSIFDGIGTAINTAWNAIWGSIGGTVVAVFNGVLGAIAAFNAGVDEFFSGLGASANALNDAIGAAFVAIATNIGDLLGQGATIAVQVWEAMWSGLISLVTAGGSAIGELIGKLLDWIVGAFGEGNNKVGATEEEGLNNLGKLWSTALNGLGDIVGKFLNWLSPEWAIVGQNIANAWAAAWTTMANVVSSAVQFMAARLSELATFAKSALSAIGDALGTDLVGALAGFFSGPVGGQTAAFSGAVAGGAGAAINALPELVATALSYVKGQTQAAIKGLQDFGKAAGDVLNGIGAEAEARIAAVKKQISDGLALANALKAPANEAPTVGDPSSIPGGGGPKGKGGGGDGKKGLTDAEIAAKAQDIYDKFLRDIAKLSESTANDITKVAQKASEAWAQALAENNDAINKANTSLQKTLDDRDQKKFIAGYEKERKDALDKELSDSSLQRTKLIEDAELKHSRLLEDQQKFYDDERAKRERAFQETLDVASRTRSDTLREADATYAALQKKRTDDLQKQQDTETKALQIKLDAAALARKDAQDKAAIDKQVAKDTAEAQQKYAEDVAAGVKKSIAQSRLDTSLKDINKKAADDRAALTDREKQAADDKAFADSQQKQLDDLAAQHEIARAAFAATLDAEAEVRRKQQEVDDYNFQKEQDKKLRDYRVEEDAKELKLKRDIEDAEVVRKRDQAANDAIWAKNQDLQKEALQKQFDTEQEQREQVAAQAEHDIQIRQAEKTLADKQVKIRQQLADELADLKVNLGEKIDTIQRDFNDKVQGLMEEANRDISPIVDVLTANMLSNLQAIRDSATDAATKLAEVFGAQDKLKAAEDARANAPQSPEDLPQPTLPDRQYGGFVPGKFGSKQWIMAHGGEYYEGLGASGVAMAAVRAAEAMAQRQPIITTNQTNYNVNASYGRVQDAGSLRQDLSALVQLTRH